MKRLIFLLALITFGFAGMSMGNMNNLQAAPPDVVCINNDIGTNSPAIHVTSVVVVVDAPFIAIVPMLAVDLAYESAYIEREAVIKPPGTLTNNQAKSNILYCNARDWVTHRSNLSERISFMLTNFLTTPTAFD